jgi:hypothetical protein
MFTPSVTGAAARTEADRVVSDYGLTKPQDITLEAIAWDWGIRVKTGPIIGAEAWLMRKGRRGIIRVRDTIPEIGRYRFCVAHELGHWRCHATQSQAWLCTSRDIHTYMGSAAEIEANAFASSLLMPRKMLLPRLEQAPLSIDLICQLAAEFQTTLTSTAIRVVEESKENCSVVFSQRNIVRWWRRSRKSDFVLPASFSISDESLAFDCRSAPGRTTGPQEVTSSVWRQSRDTDVWEESALLGDYGTVA